MSAILPLCAKRISCPGTDSPFLNMSSEAPDVVQTLTFIEFDEDTHDWPVDPPLPPPTDFLWYVNTAYTCRVRCADGSFQSYTVPPGMFGAETQAQADAQAAAFACDAARFVCGGGNADDLFGGQQLNLAVTSICKDTPYEEQVTIAGARFDAYAYRNFWEITSGSLPPGLTLAGGWRNYQYAVLSGTPTTAGTYGFTVRVTTASGNFVEKLVTFVVGEIVEASLDDATVGAPYSKQLTYTGPAGVAVWTLESGALPDGLTLSTDGLISGTPTTAETAVFTVRVVVE